MESRYPSPFKVWNSDVFLRTLFGAFFSLKFDEVNDSNIRTALSLRYYIPSQFKPAVAKSIYTTFNSRKVLDLVRVGAIGCAAFTHRQKPNFITV